MEEEFPNFVWPEGVELQQYLPFTVLKLMNNNKILLHNILTVATVLTVYGIETGISTERLLRPSSCNSTYRLRY